MYIHKYQVPKSSDAFYLISETRSRPSGTIVNLGPDQWLGAAWGNRVPNVGEAIKGLTFSKEKPVEETPAEKKEPKKGSVSIADFIRMWLVEPMRNQG